MCRWLLLGLAFLASQAGALDSSQLAVVVNMADPQSVRIGEYYAAKRRILFHNFIRIEFTPGKSALSLDEFAALKSAIDEQTASNVQAYAVTWAAPYRVECMSLTAALAFGIDLALCADGCAPTRRSAYFDSPTRQPFRALRLRPAMAIAARSFDEAKALIDRGVAADGTFPEGTAYFLTTSDRARSVRSASYPFAEKVLEGRVRVRRLQQDALADARDVLLYFVGAQRVEHLDSLAFRPGAVADHMTSSGGMLTDSHQMSALRWLEAGATGSYGTVVEPCNLPRKFPDPAVLARYYVRGETLIEAYWKSVQMPGQGIFVGEPLAAPFQRTRSVP